MDNPLPVVGQLVFIGALLLAAIAAYGQVIRSVSRPNDETLGMWFDFRRSCRYAALLAAAQVALLALAYGFPQLRSLAGVGWFYLVCAATVPFLWAGGKMHERTIDLPMKSRLWGRQKKLICLAFILVAGVVGSMVLFHLVGAEPGEAMEQIGDSASSGWAMALLMIWLIMNAPWMEELGFRHYILPLFIRWWGNGRGGVFAAVMVIAIIFAIGHSAHLEPAWAKLVQVSVWGVALGYVRLAFGTPYAIALHLGWNLSAPVVALSIV